MSNLFSIDRWDFFLINKLISFVLSQFSFLFLAISLGRKTFTSSLRDTDSFKMERNDRQSVNTFRVTSLNGYENLQVILSSFHIFLWETFSLRCRETNSIFSHRLRQAEHLDSVMHSDE